MTTRPFIETVSSMSRIPSTAAASAEILSPRPTHRPAPIAPISVTRTSSSARFRSGRTPVGPPAGCSTTCAMTDKPTTLRERNLHPLGRLDPDQIEAPCDHVLRRPAERESELLLVRADDAEVVVEAVEVIGDADGVDRQRVRGAPLRRLDGNRREVRQALEQVALEGVQGGRCAGCV